MPWFPRVLIYYKEIFNSPLLRTIPREQVKNGVIELSEEELRRKLRELARIENSAEGFSAVPGLENAPEKMAGYTEVLLKVKSLQAKYETLRKLYEQARLEEQREFIYVEIIDPPSEPDVPVKPKRALIVAVAGLSSLMLGIFLALFADWLSAVRERRREGQPDQTGS